MSIKSIIHLCCFVLLNVWISYANANVVEKNCRIKGYAFELKCTPLPAHSLLNKKINFVLYRIPAKARYPLSDPIVYMPGTLSKSPTGRALNLAQAYSRILTKRDFIWLDMPVDEHPSPCQPENPRKIADYLEVNLNKTECIQTLQRSVKDYWKLVQEVYPQNLILALEKNNISHINIISDGAGIQRLNQIQLKHPSLIKKRVILNPANFSENNISLKANALQQSITDLDKLLCIKQHPCDANKSLSNKLEQLLKQLPKQYIVNNPVSNQQERLDLTPDHLFKIVESASLSDASLIALPLALSKAIDHDDIQSLLGISSYGWATDTKNAKINWDIATAEKCMHLHIKPQPNNNASIFIHRYQQYLWNNYEKSCSPLIDTSLTETRKSDIGHFSGLVFSNHKDLNLTYHQGYHLHLPQIKGDLLTHGCATDIVYKYIHQQSLLENDVACLKQIPPLSPKVMGLKP